MVFLHKNNKMSYLRGLKRNAKNNLILAVIMFIIFLIEKINYICSDL